MVIKALFSMQETWSGPFIAVPLCLGANQFNASPPPPENLELAIGNWLGAIRQLLLHHMASLGHNVLNSSHPCAAYTRQWTVSALVEVMACCLFGAKPSPEPVLAYCQLDSREQISVKFESEFYNFFSRKCIWKNVVCQNGGHFVQGVR